MRIARFGLLVTAASLLIALCAFPVAPAFAESSRPATQGAPTQQRELGNCGDYITIFRQTGPVEAWGVRVTGVDLTSLIGAPRGEMDLVINSQDGAQNLVAARIPFDEFNAPSRFTTVNGPAVQVLVNVEAGPANGRGCSTNRTVRSPGP